MTIIYFGFGINVNDQIMNCNGLHSIFCCPSEVPGLTHSNKIPKAVQISLSHIFWNNGKEWKISGFLSGFRKNALKSLKTSLMVRSSENRIIFIDENKEIMIAMKDNLKKLCHQCLSNTEQKSLEIKDITVQDNALLSITKCGKLFNSGIEMMGLRQKIKEVAVGKEHFLALTQEGSVLSWGSGMKGQLGNGEIAVVESPEEVKSLSGLCIMSIDCGGWHSLALSDSGDVYVWGWNDVGQLGLPSSSLRSDGVKWDDICCDQDQEYSCNCSRANISRLSEHSDNINVGSRLFDGSPKAISEQTLMMINLNRNLEVVNVQATPRLLDYWKEEWHVCKVACGDRHSVFLFENGTVWTTGWNMYGQLGLGDLLPRDEPQLLRPFAGAAVDVFAGGWNTVVAMER